jgi:hypothetical protein
MLHNLLGTICLTICILLSACSSTLVKPEYSASKVVEKSDVQLISPVRSRLNFNKSKWVKFVWEPPEMAGQEFQLEISKKQTFERLLTVKTTKHELELMFDEPATYYWRVRTNNKNDSIVSLTSFFELIAKSKGE